ncbi:thioredoxin domain-containing protein [Sphingobacterium tabacisoli]|uniref:Thioredoxin domain-containing protein n=1 Tax=Sphingobacterium tabacisoli TaxID=2044855 RepID=A0ABW5L922_9SPHI|nr:hypothetical protein [Sphingobacterium tabacisoli]
MKYLIFIVLTFGIGYGTALAQSRNALKIGDVLEDVEVKVWHAGKEETLILQKNGKPLIMDFGTTYCPPCIKAYNHMNEALPHLKGKLGAYFVTNQSLDEVKKFFGRKDLFKQLNVPIIYEDTLLHTLFEHATQPHIAWLDAGMALRHLTHHTEVKEEYMNRFSAGERLTLARKNDFPYDYSQLLSEISRVQLAPDHIPKVLNSVTLTDQIEGVMPTFRTFPEGASRPSRILVMNLDVLTIFKQLYSLIGQDGQIEPSQIIVEDVLGNEMSWDDQIAWLYKRKFCIETYSENRKIELDSGLIDAFSDAFGINVQMENRERTVWIIKDKPLAKIIFDPKEQDKDNSNINDFLKFYNSKYGLRPVFNESVLQRKAVNWKMFDIKKENFSFESIKESLESKGLTMTEEVKLAKCLIIRLF